MSNQQARMIGSAIIIAGGMVACVSTGNHGDASPSAITGIGLVVFLIEFIRSYRRQ
jgi:hypothetical protein